MTAPKARGNLQVVAGVTKKPDLSDPVLRAKLAKGMGHNYYGEPAWPNDLLYIFPVVILGTIAFLAVAKNMIATYNEIGEGKKTWGDMGMHGGMGVLLLVFVVYLLTQAATVIF